MFLLRRSHTCKPAQKFSSKTTEAAPEDQHIRPQQQHSPSSKEQKQDQNNENQQKEKTKNTQKHNEFISFRGHQEMAEKIPPSHKQIRTD